MSDEKVTLTAEEIIRAWKDEEFRNSLTQEQRAALPPAPTAMGELSDEELEAVAGGCACACGVLSTMTSAANQL
jgi:mersacidin/lichenicidin family type 2 lantibiotic